MLVRKGPPGDVLDRQARYIEVAVDGAVASIYLPNGNPHPGRSSTTLVWFDRLIAHAGGLLKAGVPVALVGDYNVVPTEFDIYKNTHARNALLQPAPREAYRRLLAQGWTDALLGRDVRTTRPSPSGVSSSTCFRTDHGMRLDHFLLSPDLAARLEASGVDREDARQAVGERPCAGVGGDRRRLVDRGLRRIRVGVATLHPQGTARFTRSMTMPAKLSLDGLQIDFLNCRIEKIN